MIKINMKETRGSEILAGALAGREVLGKLLQSIPSDVAKPTALYLDFADVEVATASFLRESLVAFRDIVRRGHPFLYPVIANANAAVREEILELLRTRPGAFITCTMAKDGEASEVNLLGDLDLKQRVTFELVKKLGVTDAGHLTREHNEDGVQSTAWNNRLSMLSDLGLIVEMSEGRSKRYRPLFSKEA